MQRQCTSFPRPAGPWWLIAILKGKWHFEGWYQVSKVPHWGSLTKLPKKKMTAFIN
jgi:hypothetical protein